MEWLNYHHLLYFYTVAKEGSVSRAANVLRLAQPTLSGQIRKLEEAFDEKLFQRSGRHLVLTEMGRVVYRYADEIFTIGRELTDTLRGRPTGRPGKLSIGVADVVPKGITHRLLEVALTLPEPVQIICHEGKTERLLAELAVHNYDLVITDAPLQPHLNVKAYNHPLGECPVTFFASRALAQAHGRRFPRSLDGAPMLLPTANTSLRRSLDQWFQDRDVRPQIVAEFDDSALLKAFGQHGHGIFPAPSVLASEIRKQYGVRALGIADGVLERFFAISVERRIKHPAVAAITEAARERIFRNGKP
ncbi:MAG: transcriptional activator NhaR [Proteobacteria bacterium]|nr:MAG: transcriptional activator NhaR [Pseudomonadota bacterium]